VNRAEEEALIKLVEALAGNVQALTDVVVVQQQALAHLGKAQENMLNTNQAMLEEIVKLQGAVRMEGQRVTNLSARLDASNLRNTGRLEKLEGVYGSRRMA